MREPSRKHTMRDLLRWCASVVAPVETVGDGARGGPAQTHMACRLRAESGYCYLKTHRAPGFWESEVHAYERWAPVFGAYAPKLLAAREAEPRAILITALGGECQENSRLPLPRQREVWRAAGEALRALHDLGPGDFSGACRHDGTCAGTPVEDAEEFVRMGFEDNLEQGLRCGYLSSDESATLERALQRIPAFAGERPVPCHRDYNPVNWLTTPEGVWTGVVDFEFSRWDLRVNDFARYPDWEWERRPELVRALLEGYDRPLTDAEEQQLLVLRASYALTAIVMGRQASMHGWEREGHEALQHLAGLL